MSRRSQPRRGNDTGAALLPIFFAATVTMVLAVVAMASIDSDWADLAAVALLVIVAGLLLLAIGRQLGDADDAGDDAEDDALRR